MIRRTYDGWGYSPLKQITSDNVKRLAPAWVFSTGVNNGHEAPPIFVNGVMFVSTPGNQVLAIDARTGVLLWRYRRPLPSGVILIHPTSRGVAVYNDKVYFAAGEAVLVALDAKTGQEVWTAPVGDNARGLLPVACTPGGRWQGARRHVRRRARHPGIRVRVRCGDGQRNLENLHGPRAGRARE